MTTDSQSSNFMGKASIRQEIKNLAAELAEEEEAAMDLWTCLPSHKDACERHGENALSYCPNPRGVMREAEEAFRVLADHDSEDRTGRISFFGCRCDTHDHVPKEETVEAVLGRYQPGFRWGQGLVDSDAEVKRLKKELHAAEHRICAALEETNRALCVGLEFKDQRDAAREDASGQKARGDALGEALGACEHAARIAASINRIDHQAALWVVARKAQGALTTHGAGPSGTGQAHESDVLLDLQDQLKRLMATPCSSMAFGFGPEETAKAVTSEVEEILAEPAGSEAAQRECAGLLAAAVRMAMVHGADPVECMRREALRLKTRLDTMDRLACSWAAAKVVEGDPRLERLWVAITMDAVTCDIAAWCTPGDDSIVVVMPRGPLDERTVVLVSDCFKGVAMRIAPLFGAWAWGAAICSATFAGCTVAVRDEQGPRFEKAKS